MNTVATYAGIPIPVIEGLTADQVLTLINCRGFEQYESMRTDYDAGKCPFCDPLDKKNVVIAQSVGGWRIWKNPFPIKHSVLHLMMAPIKHIMPEQGLNQSDFTQIGALMLGACREFDIIGGGFVMRFGTPKFNAGSVLHLHANIIVPDQTGDIQVTLAKNPKKFQEAIARMHIYGRLYAGVQVSELLEYEQKLVEGRI